MSKPSLEETVKILKDMKVTIPLPQAAITQKKRNSAIDMAIEALNCSEMPNNSDCISRQAAIDAANDWLLDCFKVKKQDRSCGLIRRLEDLPPAQPDTRLEKIADLVDGSIDHFDLEDAMDLLYQIKDVLNG